MTIVNLVFKICSVHQIKKNMNCQVKEEIDKLKTNMKIIQEKLKIKVKKKLEVKMINWSKMGKIQIEKQIMKKNKRILIPNNKEMN